MTELTARSDRTTFGDTPLIMLLDKQEKNIEKLVEKCPYCQGTNIEIDQSGKIENTSKNTIIAFSNGCFRSIIIRAREKREIQKIFRKIGKKKIFIYKTFSILIFLLIKNYLNNIDKIIIDVEYQGNEDLIKTLLLKEIRKIKNNFSKDKIIFYRIGKKSRAHFLAYGVAIGKKSADIEVTAKDILKFLK